MTAKEILDVLNTFKDITPEIVGESWKEIYAGDVKFQLPNGWVLVVFNDCDSWDYVDSVYIGPHHKLEFWGCPDTDEIWELRNWEPNDIGKWSSL